MDLGQSMRSAGSPVTSHVSHCKVASKTAPDEGQVRLWQSETQIELPFKRLHVCPSSGSIAVYRKVQVFDVELRAVRNCRRRQVAMFSDVVCE